MARSRKIKRRRLPRGGKMPTPKSWSSGQLNSEKRQKNEMALVNSANKHSQSAVNEGMAIANTTFHSNIPEVRNIEKMMFRNIVPVRNMVNTVKQLPSLPTKFREELAERNSTRIHKPLTRRDKQNAPPSEVNAPPSEVLAPPSEVITPPSEVNAQPSQAYAPQVYGESSEVRGLPSQAYAPQVYGESSELRGLPSQAYESQAQPSQAYESQAQAYESQAQPSQAYESQEASAPTIFTGGRRISRRHYGGNMPLAEGFAEGQVVSRQKKLNQLAQTQYATAQADGSVAQSTVAVAETVGAVPGSLQDTLPKAAAIQSTKAKSQASSAQIMIAPFVRAEEVARQAAIAEAEARARAQALAEQQAAAEAEAKARTQIQQASTLDQQLMFAQYQQNMIALYTYNNIEINTKRTITDFVNAVLKGPQDMANVAATYLNQMGEMRYEYSINLANIIVNNATVAMAIASQALKYDEAIMNLNIANRGVIPALEQNVPPGFQVRQQMGGYRKMRGGVMIKAVTIPQETREEEVRLEQLSDAANAANAQSKTATAQASLAVQRTLGARLDSLEYRLAQLSSSNASKSSAQSSTALSVKSQRIPPQMNLIKVARKASLLTGIVPQPNQAMVMNKIRLMMSSNFVASDNPMQEGSSSQIFAKSMNDFFTTEDPQVMANYGRSLLDTVTTDSQYVAQIPAQEVYCTTLARLILYCPSIAACVGCQSIRYNSMAMKVVNIPPPSNRFTTDQVYNAILPYIPIKQTGGYKKTQRRRSARHSRRKYKTSRK